MIDMATGSEFEEYLRVFRSRASTALTHGRYAGFAPQDIERSPLPTAQDHGRSRTLPVVTAQVGSATAHCIQIRVSIRVQRRRCMGRQGITVSATGGIAGLWVRSRLRSPDSIFSRRTPRLRSSRAAKRGIRHTTMRRTAIRLTCRSGLATGLIHVSIRDSRRFVYTRALRRPAFRLRINGSGPLPNSPFSLETTLPDSLTSLQGLATRSICGLPGFTHV